MGIMRTLTINGTKYNVTPIVPASSVTLLASAWMGSEEAYYQVVELPGVTPNTKVDLQPTSEQLAEFHHKVLAFVAENEGGVVTVYAIGDKPAGDHTIQTTLTEVESAGKIRGNTVGTTMPRPDWNQTDPTKADYIKNKEGVDTHLVDGNNPHGVTAEQVGARSDTWMPTAEEVGARPSDWTPTAEEVGARPNTWSPTSAEIGAVAKTDLKVFAYTSTDENGDIIFDGITSYPTTPGVFRVNEPVAELPSGSLGYGSLVIFKCGSYWLHLYQDADDDLYWARIDNSVTLPNANGWHRIYDNVNKPTPSEVGAAPAIESTDHPGCYYRIVGGNTEWINPPMVVSGEYRTTERWNGRAVYTKLIDLGVIPVGERDIDIGFYSGLIRHYAVTDTNRSVLDTGTTVGEWDVSVKIFQNTARVTGGASIGSNNEKLYLQVWYTKP